MFLDQNEIANLPEKATCVESEEGKCTSPWGNSIFIVWREKRLYYNIAINKHMRARVNMYVPNSVCV